MRSALRTIATILTQLYNNSHGILHITKYAMVLCKTYNVKATSWRAVTSAVHNCSAFSQVLQRGHLLDATSRAINGTLYNIMTEQWNGLAWLEVITMDLSKLTH